MSSESRINIISKLPPGFSSNVIVNNTTYHVQTEDMGVKTSRIVTRVYLKGEIVSSKTSNYSHLGRLDDFEVKLVELMKKQHKTTIEQFMLELSGHGKEKIRSDYVEKVKKLSRLGKAKSALATLKIALEKFPEDPFLLSYYGYLISAVENRPYEGVKICRDAIVRLDNSMPFGSEFFYPALYLNLGRAYLKINKKEAASTFRAGLKSDPNNRDLLWELKKLGTRRTPVVPFLHRDNPINKYIGLLLSKTFRA